MEEIIYSLSHGKGRVNFEQFIRFMVRSPYVDEDCDGWLFFASGVLFPFASIYLLFQPSYFLSGFPVVASWIHRLPLENTECRWNYTKTRVPPTKSVSPSEM